jgi:hypothetical protein
MKTYKKFKKLKIENIEIDNDIDFRIIFKETYESTKKDFEKEFNVTLPNISGAEFDKMNNDLRVIIKPITVKIKSNLFSLIIEVDPGFITDFASIPKPLRSIVDNDEWYVIIAAIVHDALYGGRLLERINFEPYDSFILSNEMFSEIIKYYKGNKIKANIMRHFLNYKIVYKNNYLNQNVIDKHSSKAISITVLKNNLA